MKKILVVVDMQNDFIDGPLGTPEARAIVDNVCAKIREGEWDYIYGTMDSHYNNYLELQEGRKLPVEHCIMDTPGWMLNIDISKAIATKGIDIFERIYKRTFGSVQLAEAIEYLLSCEDFDVPYNDLELTLVGVCTDICVVSNALLLKAHFPEMKIVVDANCCAGSTPDKHYMALEVMKSCQVDVVNNEWDEVKKDIHKVVCKAYGVPEEFWTDKGEWITKNFVEE